jgi:hypothetical protein
VAVGALVFRDGLGDRRLAFDREAGRALELLRLRPELTALEPVVAARVARLAPLADRRLTRLCGVASDQATGDWFVASEAVEGERLSEVLERAHVCRLVPDLTVALYVVRQALEALAALEAAGAGAHGTLGLERVIVTPRGRIVVADYAFAPLVERLGFDHRRLWRSLRLAMPTSPEPVRVDGRADVAQVAVMLLALALGRPLRDDEYPDHLEALAAEVREIAGIRGGAALADAVGDWLELALPAATRPFANAADARNELERTLPQDPSVAGTRHDVREFLDQVAEAEAILRDTAEVAAPAAAPIVVAPAANAGDLAAEAVVFAAAERPEAALSALEAAGTAPAATSEPAPSATEAVDGVTAPLVAEATEEAVAEATAPLAAEATAEGAATTTAHGVAEETAEAVAEVAAHGVIEDAFVSPMAAPVGGDAPVLETGPEPAAAPVVFDFSVPPAPERVPDAVPRSRLIADLDVSRLPDWMLAPEPPPPPDSQPAPPPTPPTPSVAPAPATWTHLPEPPPEPVELRRVEPPPAAAPAFVTPPAETPVDERVDRTKRFVQELLVRGRRDGPARAEREPRVGPAVAAAGAPEPARRVRRRRRLVAAVAAVSCALAVVAMLAIRWAGARAASGTLVLESTPPGSAVRVDGEPRGTTPLTLMVAPGRHTVEFRWQDDARAVTVEVAAGGTRTETLDWTRVAGTGTLRVGSDPAGAQVIVDGRLRGETPLEVAGLRPGPHTVVVRGAGGSVTERVQIAANDTATLDVLIYPGWLAVFAPVDVEIFEHGRRLGTSADGRIVVPPGPHRVELVNEAYGYRATQTVDVRPGAVASVSVEPKVPVSVSATPWAHVFLDGQFLGETPLVDVPVTIGTREFVLRHPEYGERRVVAVVTFKAPVHLSVDLAKGATRP